MKNKGQHRKNKTIQKPIDVPFDDVTVCQPSDIVTFKTRVSKTSEKYLSNLSTLLS
jgi:hypothetical protein